MANTFKLKTKANVGISTQNVYVVPSATTTVVIGITLANTSGAGCLVGGTGECGASVSVGATVGTGGIVGFFVGFFAIVNLIN